VVGWWRSGEAARSSRLSREQEDTLEEEEEDDDEEEEEEGKEPPKQQWPSPEPGPPSGKRPGPHRPGLRR